LSLRKRCGEIFSARQLIEDEIRKQKGIKDIANYHIQKLRKQLHKNENEIHTLLEEAISEAEGNDETIKQIQFEMDERKFGRLGGNE